MAQTRLLHFLTTGEIKRFEPLRFPNDINIPLIAIITTLRNVPEEVLQDRIIYVLSEAIEHSKTVENKPPKPLAHGEWKLSKPYHYKDYVDVYFKEALKQKYLKVLQWMLRQKDILPTFSCVINNSDILINSIKECNPDSGKDCIDSIAYYVLNHLADILLERNNMDRQTGIRARQDAVRCLDLVFDLFGETYNAEILINTYLGSFVNKINLPPDTRVGFDLLIKKISDMLQDNNDEYGYKYLQMYLMNSVKNRMKRPERSNETDRIEILLKHFDPTVVSKQEVQELIDLLDNQGSVSVDTADILINKIKSRLARR